MKLFIGFIAYTSTNFLVGLLQNYLIGIKNLKWINY